MLKAVLQKLGFFKEEVLSAEDRTLLNQSLALLPKYDVASGEKFDWYYKFLDLEIPPFDPDTGKPSGVKRVLLFTHHSKDLTQIQTFWTIDRGLYHGVSVHYYSSFVPPPAGTRVNY